MKLRAHLRGALPRACENLDNAGHRIGAVQYAHRSADNFDPVHVIGREMSQIDEAARLIQRHAVEQHLGVIALAAPHEERCLPAEAPGLDHVRTGHRCECLRDCANAPSDEIRSPQHRHSGCDDVRSNRHARRRYHHRFQHDGILWLLHSESEHKQRDVHPRDSFG